MNVSARCVPPLPAPILELICDELAADVQRLNRIIAAWPASTCLGDIINTTPVADYLPAPEPLIYHCKHGSQPGYVPSRLTGPLLDGAKGKGTKIWTPEYGVTFYGRALKFEADASYDYSNPPRKFRTSTCVILPLRPPCVRCDVEEKDDHQRKPLEKSRRPDRGYQVCPAIDLPVKAVRFHQVTAEDVAWAERQAAFPHSQSMPRLLTHFCGTCSEEVVVNDVVRRTTRGLYLPKDHECSPTPRRVEGVPVVTPKIVGVRSSKFHSEEAAQEHFEKKMVSFVGDGVDLEVIEGFNHNPRPNHSDQREKDLMGWAQRSQVGAVVGPTCIRCASPITKRKGTKYCSENCKKRQWEQINNQGAN